jgi:hypothetical protein
MAYKHSVGIQHTRYVIGEGHKANNEIFIKITPQDLIKLH